MMESLVEAYSVILFLALLGLGVFGFTFFFVLGLNVWYDDQREKWKRKKNAARSQKED